MFSFRPILPALLLFVLSPEGRAAEPSNGSLLWQPENLHAWCIVPFDAKQRGPAERATMTTGLGLHKIAYDWRDKHVPEFEEEILAYQKQGIEFFAFWGAHDKAFALFEKYDLHPQIWIMAPNPNGTDEAAKIKAAAEQLLPLVEKTRALGCPLALYNHGGWNGEPATMAAIAEYLRTHHKAAHVGIVYNFHHGHSHITAFADHWKIMQPYLLAVNLNGMVMDGDKTGRKIMTLGTGDKELGMMKIIQESGWTGPVGIIDHREETDSEETLRENLRGLDWLRKELAKPGSGGPQPKAQDHTSPAGPATDRPVIVPGRFGKALDARAGGLVQPGDAAFQKFPLTISCWARLEKKDSFNILIASEEKAAPTHWELYSYAKTGHFHVYLPGQGGDFGSGIDICDNEWHHVAAVLEEKRIRLYVDGVLTKDAPLSAPAEIPAKGGLALGRLVEGGIGCQGLVDEAHIQRGVFPPIELPREAPVKNEQTLGLWSLEEAPVSGVTEVPAKPVGFIPKREPHEPGDHLLRDHPVNQHRLYDFYAKQALWWHEQPVKPMLISPFPGLDAGQFGHWGSQTEASWESDEWNQMDLGQRQSGVFRRDKLVVPRAVCVRLGKMAVCFDPETLRWVAAWQGGFLRYDKQRFGFMGGIRPEGGAIPLPDSIPADSGTFTYHGYYRHGDQTIFSYEKDGVTWLESAVASGDKVGILREKSGGSLGILTKGGPPQWPEVFSTKGSLGEGKPYAIDTLTVPAKTPWNSLFYIGGHDFLPNGDAVLCTFQGEVWQVGGIDESLTNLTWRRIAAGLHQPLGLRVVDGKICVTGRDQITRLHDLNDDGETDFYECLFRGYVAPVGGHDYVSGLERDKEGRWYFASGAQGLMRSAADQRGVEIISTGLRNPNGIGLGPKGEVTVGVQEGEWTPASQLYEFLPEPGQEPAHAGAGGPRPGPRGHVPPLVYLPRGVDHSCGGQVFVEGNQWGIPEGSLIHFSWGNGAAFLILRQTTRNFRQGTIIPLPGDFLSGSHRGRFNVNDGQLYVSGMSGWTTYGPDKGSFQRMRYTGEKILVPRATEARENGVLLHFDEPLSNETAADANRYFAQQWNYRYSSAYGSDEYSVNHPEQTGHDVLAVTSAHVVENGRSLFLEIPQIKPCHVLHVRGEQPGWMSRDLFLTIHEISPPYTSYPGYQAIAKTPMTSGSITPAHPAQAAAGPVKWEEGKPGRPMAIQTAAGLLFAQKELHAKAGERISLTLENPDVLPHNWVLLSPGSLERVGDLANKLITAPNAVQRHYVPDSQDVLVHTRLVDAGKTTTIHFDAPSAPGRYPYVCTFPGHWMLMRGEMIVE